ncbi:MAG: hypothetical protein CMA72_05965 [Euryarchaeota archaeon]|nr:hypothetical protein [Euryarchaeota archaeon]
MGIFNFEDPQTGKLYKFTIAGDAPSNTEFGQITQILDRDRTQIDKKYESVFGEAPEPFDDGTALGRGYERGKKQIKEAFGETIGTIGERTGLGFLESYGTGLEERARQEQGLLSLTQPERMQSTDVDSIGSALTYAGEVVGEQAPLFGLGVAGAATTAVAAPILGAGTLATSALGFTAYGAAQAPILFGNNVQRREDVVGEGNLTDDDIYNALKATFGQAALESISGKLLLRSPFRAVGKNITGAKGLLVRTGSRAAGGGTTEGLTEVGQQIMERAQAGLEIDSEDAMAEYREAAIAGGLLGGGIRATGIGERGDAIPKNPVVPTIDKTPEQEAQDAVEAEADKLLADGDTELTDAQKAVVAQEGPEAEAIIKNAKEKVEEYSPKKEDDSTAETNQEDLETKAEIERLKAKIVAENSPTVITTELLDDLGINSKSPLRMAKKRNIVGLSVTDPKVRKELEEYRDVSNASKETKDKVAKLLGDIDAGEAGFRNGRIRGSLPSGRDRLAKLFGRRSERRNTGTSDPSNAVSMGTNLSNLDESGGPKGSESDTLTAKEREIAEQEAAFEQMQTPVVSKEQVTENDVEDLTKQVDDIVTEPIVSDATQANAVSGQRGGTQLIPGANYRYDKALNQKSGPILQDDPLYAPSEVPPNQVQGASVPQAQLQAAEDTRDQEAQTKLNALFEDGRRSAQAQEYHDTQVDSESTPEVTTAVDKEGIVELLNISDADLKDDAPALAAKNFFKRFRRPVDALAEIGAVSVSSVGFTQTQQLDFVKDYNLKKGKGKPIKTAKELKDEDMTADFSFYNGITQPAAVAARRWVHENMSRGAILEMINARRIASRDTAPAMAIDAIISARTKNINEIIRKDNNYQKKQQAKAAKEYAAAERLKAANELLNKRLAPDSSMAKDIKTTKLKSGTELFRVTTPIKGRTAFESYLIGTGLKLRQNNKVSTVLPQTTTIVYDPEAKSVISGEEIMGLYDGYVYSRDLGYLLVDPVHGLDQALLPSIRNALQRGDLPFVLNAIATTSSVPRVRQIAGKLAEVAGTTQVQVVDDLSTMVGRKAAGLFEPETNTISIDATNGMNVHTILHEMTHAATSASLANPKLPEIKQLNTLFNAVREQFGEVYGTANLDEFVAEAFSNPEFQSALSLTRVDGGKMSGWEKFTGAVRRIIRKLVGLKPKSPESVLDEVDRIINGMLTPSPDTRAAPSMLLATATPEGSSDVVKSSVEAVSPSKRAEYVDMASDMVYNRTEPASRGIKNIVLGSLDSRILADVAKKKIPFAPELNILIRKMSGAMRSRNDALDAMTNNYVSWTRKNKAAAKIMNNIIPKSTALRVDPSYPRAFYSSYKAAYNDIVNKKSVVKEFKSAQARTAWVENFNKNHEEAKTTKAKNMKDPDPQDLVAYDALRKQYNAMGKEGQAFYRQMRNFFQDTYDEILPALRARLEATISDPKTRASAFEKLSEILMKESGIIKPYFPLMRKGKHRLQYSFLNEEGQPEIAVEYYQNRRQLDKAFKVAESVSAVGTKPEYTRADQVMKFKSVPSSSFVYEILKTMEASKPDFKDPAKYDEAVQSVVDLALDAMPERSFMQGFRRRKDVRGYIGDNTPTKIGDTEFDAVTMMKEKGRDLNRQIVQIQAAAEIEKFRNKLKEGNFLKNPETADIARKLDQIASFAQKPNVPRWSQVANGVGFNMTMGMNFSSAAITFFDVAMSAMPVISAEYGVNNTARAYGEATSLIMNAPKTRGIMVSGPDGKPIEQEVKMGIIGKSSFNYKFEQLPPEMQKIRADILFETAADQGQANQSMTQESLEIGRDAPMEGINKWTSGMFHHAERFNRETTLTASYALEVRKLQAEGKQLTDQDYKDAAQKAIETTEFTLGSTAAAGRPVWAQTGVGNILFLFKRFAIAKYYMMYKLGHESIGSTNVAKIMQDMGVTEAEAQQISKDRKLARIGLRNFMISTGVMAGAGGMPMMGSIGFIVNLLKDDDEDDFESSLRKFTGEGIYGGAANELLGIDVANRISLNSLLYRPPFVKKEDQSPIWTLAEQLGGPVVGISVSTLRGGMEFVEGFTDSDPQAMRRGSETVLPASIRNVLKAVRFGTEGATTRRGDPITEDINAYNVIMQAAGFAPQSYIQQLEFNKNARRREEAVSSRRTKLLRRRNMALRNGDREGVQEAERLIQKYNDNLPRGAEKSRITREAKERSYRTFGTTTSKMRGGMTYTPFMESIVEDFDKGFQGF